MNSSASVFLYLNNSCLIIKLSTMNFLSLCLMTAVLLASFCDGDLVISDFEKSRHWLVTNDLKLLVTFDIKNDGKRILQLKARKSDDGIVTYIVYEEEIKMFKTSKDGKVSESGTIALNRKIEPAAPTFAFDVQPSGKYMVMSSEKELYFFSQEDKKLSKLLESDYLIWDVLIHPTKRTVYYSACSSNNAANLLFVYDMDAKVKKQIQIPLCFERIFLDLKENLIWASTYDGISLLNLTNGVTERIFKSGFDEFVSSSDNLYIMYIDKRYNYQNRRIVYLKLSKKQQVHKQTTLKDYNIQPALSHFNGSTPVLFDIDEGLIEILDNQFAKTSDKIKLEIAKKPIKSVRSMNDDQSTTFFWIHDPNGGVVEYVRISHKDKATIKRGSFKFQTGGKALEELTDFDVFEEEFYLATNTGLLNADINYDKPDQSATRHDENYVYPIKALQILKKQKEFLALNCLHFFVGNVKQLSDIKNSYNHTLTTCPEKLLWDQKDDRLLVSTSTGLFNFRPFEYELIYNEGNLRNFVLDKGFVYFVSKIDGPSIYKVAKRRTVQLNHDLQLDENTSFRITNVKEFVEKDDNKDDKGGNPKDVVTYAGGEKPKDVVTYAGGEKPKDVVTDAGGEKPKDDNGAASETTSPEKMFLLLLVQFVMHLLP